MISPEGQFDLEGGIPGVGAPLAHLQLRDLLMGGPVWLDKIFDDGSPELAGLLPGNGNVDFRWCLQIAGPSGVLVQLGLRPSLFESLGLPEHARASIRLALAEQWLSPLRPALRSFFGQDLGLRLEEARDGWPDAGPSFAFQLSIPSMRQLVPARLADAFVAPLRDLVQHRMPPRPADVPLRLFVGTRLCLPVSEVRNLEEGDVLLCENMGADAAKSVRIYAESAAAKRKWRYVATVRASDGEVQHLAPLMPLETRVPQEPMGSLVSLDVLEACLDSSSARCRTLAIGRCVHEWHRAVWLQTPELRVGGRPWAKVRPARRADRAGYEIVKLHRLGLAS